MRLESKQIKRGHEKLPAQNALGFPRPASVRLPEEFPELRERGLGVLAPFRLLFRQPVPEKIIGEQRPVVEILLGPESHGKRRFELVVLVKWIALGVSEATDNPELHGGRFAAVDGKDARMDRHLLAAEGGVFFFLRDGLLQQYEVNVLVVGSENQKEIAGAVSENAGQFSRDRHGDGRKLEKINLKQAVVVGDEFDLFYLTGCSAGGDVEVRGRLRHPRVEVISQPGKKRRHLIGVAQNLYVGRLKLFVQNLHCLPFAAISHWYAPGTGDGMLPAIRLLLNFIIQDATKTSNRRQKAAIRSVALAVSRHLPHTIENL